ncbi:MAG: hypothetical protein HY818_03845 [Acetobacterium woodii]|nr:hypothetical protein [Acetobacterium woodii]
MEFSDILTWIFFIICGWSLNVIISTYMHANIRKKIDGNLRLKKEIKAWCFALASYLLVSTFFHDSSWVNTSLLFIFCNVSFYLFLMRLFNKKMSDKIPNIFCFFISYDYFIADFTKYTFLKDGKKEYNKEKIDGSVLATFIQNSNKWNFIVSFILLFIGYLIGIPGYLFGEQNALWKFLFSFFSVRAISRSFEILLAFYKDIHDDDKSSNLAPSDRIKLAVRSFFEIIINFILVYYFLDLIHISSQEIKLPISIINNVYPTYFDFCVTTIINTTFISFKYFLNSTLTSLGTSTFVDVNFVPVNNELDPYANIWKNSFLILQLFSSMCLTYFALARYIGDQSGGNGLSFGKSVVEKFLKESVDEELEGDKNAKKIEELKKLLDMREKEIYNDLEKSAKRFIQKEATLEDIEELRVILNEQRKA